MGLAWKELRRNPGRFAIATFTLTLIALLLMLLAALLDGLLRSATGSYLAQPGQLIVQSEDSTGTLASSFLTADDRALVEDVLPSGASVSGISTLTLGARLDGGDERELTGVNLYGVDVAPTGVEALADGEVWADHDLGTAFAEGDVVLVGPARVALTIAGVSDPDASPSEGALWATPTTWADVVAQSRPGQATDGSQALVVDVQGEPTEDELSEIAAAIDAAAPTTTTTVEDAANQIPGVDAQRSTFLQIQGVTLAIALLVVALFFALLTVERTSLYGVLKAMGSRTSRIFAGVVLQALVVTLVASTIAAIVVVIAGWAIPPGTLPFQLSFAQLQIAVIALAVASILGSAFSLRRVLAIDPASAIGGDS